MRRRRPRHPSKGCGSGCARVRRAPCPSDSWLIGGFSPSRGFGSNRFRRRGRPGQCRGHLTWPWSSDVALRKRQDPLGRRRGAQAMTAPRLLVVSRSLPAKGEPPASFFGSAVAARESAGGRGMEAVPDTWVRTASKSADCARKSPGACSGAECVGCLSAARRRKAGCEREGLSGPARPGRASRRRQPGPRCRRRSSRGSGRRRRSSAWRPLRTSGRRRARCTSSI